jgi:glutamate synthase (NADPH/NADH) small chain
MVERMLRFITLGRAPPEERGPLERAGDFAEIYRSFASAKVAEQASRCSQCGVPYCLIHCPLQNNIPDWLKATAAGQFEDAYALSAVTNPMPEICGRICPQDRLCEGNCVIEKSGHGTVTIGAVEKFLTDTAWERGWVAPLKPGRPRGQSVGIIGAGPAGLAAAEDLRRLGYGVTIYDRYDRAGGLLTYGIPSFKLEKEIVARRTLRLQEGGVEFVLEVEIGRDIPFAELRARHDAVLIATGVYKARELEAPGAGAAGVHAAMTYLTASNRVCLGDEVQAFASGELDAKDKHVVVLGGGDTAMDCVRTAVRQGAKSVKCLYRRDQENMPGSRREVKNAADEGVEFVWLAAPKALIVGEAGRGQVVAVHAAATRLGPADAGGRQTVEEIPGSEFDVPADMVLTALGFDAEDLPAAFEVPELRLTRAGTLKIDPKTFSTNLPGVYAAGDIVRGASLVVWALRDGRDAASGIHRDLVARAEASAPVFAMAAAE